jgi:hypothetical protein
MGFIAIGFHYDKYHTCHDSNRTISCCEKPRSKFDYKNHLNVNVNVSTNYSYCFPTNKASIFTDSIDCTFYLYDSESATLNQTFIPISSPFELCWNDKTKTWTSWVYKSTMSTTAFFTLLIVFYFVWITLTCIFFQKWMSGCNLNG